MAVGDLWHVTDSIRRLLDFNVRRLMGGAAPGAISVSAVPPERIQGVGNRLNFYLYHIAEDPHFKNMPAPGIDDPPIAHAPMALNLFYILTVHHEQDSDADIEMQQRLMGMALKTLHDFAVIDDRLRIAVDPNQPPETVLHDQLRGGRNVIQIVLRPISPEDSIGFWSSEDQQTVRLSAYYE